jgi:hypothetical protein
MVWMDPDSPKNVSFRFPSDGIARRLKTLTFVANSLSTIFGEFCVVGYFLAASNMPDI